MTAVTVMIASPLEDEHVQRIAHAFGGRINLIHESSLLPPRRYVADHKGDPAWQRTARQQTTWRRLLQEAQILWDFPVGELSSPLLEIVRSLRWIQTTSAGVGPLVKKLKLDETDVIITTASGVHAGPLAEFVFATLLFHTKWLPHLLSLKTTHDWERFSTGELAGQTMAVVGMGRIGKEVARLARAFGMKVWATARRPDSIRAAELGVDRLFAREQLREMLAGADCIVLCVPETSETNGMIGRAEIDAFKPGVVFINIGRGTSVDEDALIEALKRGRVGFAGLDVFRTEPLPRASPLWDLPNVFVNPHSASTAASENEKLTSRFIANLENYLAGNYQAMTPTFDKISGY
jgi:phosphoglycerate dehydrogenase-like enzyme